VKRYSYPFRFDILIARCPGGLFFTGHNVYSHVQLTTCYREQLTLLAYIKG